MDELDGVMMHRCRVCGKGFSCGRSLGGHMRSHILFGESTAAMAAAEEDDDEVRRLSNGGGVVGYGLRENPKKTRRLSDFAGGDGEEEERGDGGGGGEVRACGVCGKLFSSWRKLFGHVRRRHESAGEEEADAAAVTVITPPPRRRRRSMRVAAPPPAPPPPPTTTVEDVALGLLMLSRDTGLWRSPPSYGHNSDEDSPLPHHAGDVTVTKSRRRRTASYNYYAPPPPNPSTSPSPKRRQQRAAATAAAPAAKRTRYECPGCGKVFASYQALGGHRASHKRINTSCSAPKLSTHSPDSVVAAAGIGGDEDDSKANKSSPAEEEKFEFDGELYAEMEMEQHHSPATAAALVAGFLDLNYPPAATASSSEVA